GERGRVDPGAFARAGERGLSDAFRGLHRECDRRVDALRRIAHRAEAGRHRHDRDRRRAGRPIVSYLPFARPTIDEAMIAAVGETLRSRWIASGPQVQAFERALSDYIGGRPVRTLTSATGAMQAAFELVGIGRGDEVITPAQ